MAHFTEFAFLGLWLHYMLSGVSRLKGRHALLLSLLIGFFAAFLDETIQIFSNRGSQVKDVWLDAAGVLFGVLLFALLRVLRRRRIQRTAEE